MLYIDDVRHPWESVAHKDARLYYKGDSKSALNVLSFVEGCPPGELPDRLLELFHNFDRYTGGVVETESAVVAWSDHIRSWPLFYCFHNGEFSVSNSARELAGQQGLSEGNAEAQIEFAMSGFVSGKNTLLEGLFCLQPGEFLVFDKNRHENILIKYFSYYPDFSGKDSFEQKKLELGRLFDEIFSDIIRSANGRKIWVPLSAGVDSRLVLCKLHELAYKNVEAFSYGPPFNFEALNARKIARALGVPWRMIASSPEKTQQFFNSESRKEYWDYTDNLKVIPNLSGVQAVKYLRDSGFAEPGDIFINGQTGDFITGGHIPKICFEQKEIDSHAFIKALMDKHYSLWLFLVHETNRNLVSSKIKKLLGESFFDKGYRERAAQAEHWEYEARQICYVVNAQRMYEFHGFDWELPFWDKRLVQFFQPLLLSDKKEQYLYKSYLREYNYRGLFPENEDIIRHWPLPVLWIVPLARIIGLLAGKGTKKRFYDYMRYYGHYSDQYRCYSSKLHRKTFRQARNVTSLSVRKWLLDNKDFFSLSFFERGGGDNRCVD